MPELVPDEARPWRCFWAVPLPDDVRSGLASLVAELQAQPGVEGAWRFTDAGGWHVTLAFLGATPAEAIEAMVSRVGAALPDIEPIEVACGGLGGFPRGGRARVMWYGVADDGGRLARMAETVRTAAGVSEEHAFRPHVTLARSRDRHGALLPVPSGVVPDGRIAIDEVVLYRSHLGIGPTRYEVLAHARLGSPSVETPTAVQSSA